MSSGKRCFASANSFLTPAGGIHGIGSRQLIDRDDSARLSVQVAGHAVVLRAQFHSRHVADAHNPGLGSFANDDLLELLRRREAALRAHRVSERLSFGNRFAAHLSGGVDGVLRLDGGDNLRNGDLQLRQLVGLHPEAHGVLAGAEHLNRADALHASQLVIQVDVGVVGQEPGVIGALGRVQGDQHQRRKHRFLNGDAVIGDIRRELRRGLRFAALRQNQIRIRDPWPRRNRRSSASARWRWR